MKSKMFMITLAFLVAVGTANAQQKIENKDVPKVVYSAFGEQYPDAFVVQWEMPDCNCYDDWISAWEREMSSEYPQEYAEPNTLYVTYKYQNNEQKSVYYRSGEWIRTKTKINKESIPEAVMNAVNNSEYNDWEIADYAYLVEKPMGNDRRDVSFRVYLKEGIKRHLLKVSFDGTILPKGKLFQ